MELDLAKELIRLTNLGYAPQIINDDRGNFAVGDEGFGRVRTQVNEPYCFNLYAETEWFSNTPEGAWEKYLDRLRKLGNEV